MNREAHQRPWYRELPGILLMNTAIGLGLTLLTAGFMPGGWASLSRTVLANQIFAQVIGTMASFLIPPVALRLQARPLVIRWTLFILSLSALGVAGAFISSALLAIFLRAPFMVFQHIFRGSAAGAAAATVAIGTGVYVIEELKRRLQRTTLELRTEELERERTRKLATEAQLGALQARLQPHFLFNTINSILALIREDPRGAEAMLERLSRLLRFALESQNRTAISLDEETRLVRDYLDIERTRFGERLRYSIEIPPDLNDLEVPPYSLQTLVENSVKYAVAPRREGGSVRVRGSRYRDALALEVRDDGCGFSRDAIPAGHGLDTLQKRLTALYGDQALMLIEDEDGAVVRLRLPVRSLVRA